MTLYTDVSENRMGSKEIFDYQQMRWVPEDQYKENERNRERDMKKRLRDAERKLKETEDKLKRTKVPVVKQVTDVAAAIERAKSEIARRRGDPYQQWTQSKRKRGVD